MSEALFNLSPRERYNDEESERERKRERARERDDSIEERRREELYSKSAPHHHAVELHC